MKIYFLNNFNKICSFLIVAIIATLITGPFIPDLLLVIVSIMFLIFCYLKKNFQYFKNFYFKFFLLFYFVCVTSSLISDYQLYSIKTSLPYIRFAVFSAALFYILNENKKLTYYLFVVSILSISFVTIDSFYQYFNGYNLIGIPKGAGGIRLSSFFGDELIVGSYLIRLVSLMLVFFYLSRNFIKKNYIKFILLIVLFFSLIVIFLSGERASFAYSLLLITYLTLMLNFDKLKFFIIFIFFLLCLIFINTFDNKIKNRMIDQTILQTGLNDKNAIIFSTDHQGHYLVAIDLFKKNPFLGIGPKNFRKNCYNEKKYSVKPFVCSSHPHNTYIQILSETGLVGFSIIFIFSFCLFFFSIKHLYYRFFKKKILFENYEICLLGCFLITLWPVIPTGNFFNNYLNIFYFFPLGIFFYCRQIKKVQKFF
jgi:O-antigen ligase